MGIKSLHNCLISATFGNPNAGGGINNGPAAIKLEAAAHAGGAGNNNYYTCATYGSPSPGANEQHQQSLLATTAYSKFSKSQFITIPRYLGMVN